MLLVNESKYIAKSLRLDEATIDRIKGDTFIRVTRYAFLQMFKIWLNESDGHCVPVTGSGLVQSVKDTGLHG